MTEPVSGPSVVATRRSPADVIVVGDGIIGLSVALAVSRAGGTSCVIGHQAAGSASPASAGLLAPSIGRPEPGIRRLMTAARERFPAFLRWLAERSGIDVPLNQRGIIELAFSPADSAALRERQGASARFLEPAALRAMEPSLAPAAGALLHAGDGFVDVAQLLAAMREAARCEWALDRVEGRVARIEHESDIWQAFTEDGRRYSARALVLAGGAWTPLIVGVPRPLPVEPVRGQMLALRGAPLQHAVAGPDAYVLPRGELTVVGSTLERVGFDHSTTKPALDRLRAAAVALLPELAQAETAAAWAGLRPLTSDGLPIISRDPEAPSLVYACGHGKNGILLAPITGECVAALLAGTSFDVDLEPFAVSRFGARGR